MALEIVAGIEWDEWFIRAARRLAKRTCVVSKRARQKRWTTRLILPIKGEIR